VNSPTPAAPRHRARSPAVGTIISQLADTALQLHGGIGFTYEHDLHLYLRRAKADETVWGNAAHHHRRVTAHLEAS